MSPLARVLLSGFGVGKIPGPAGTWASAATTLVLVALHGASPDPLAPGILVAVLGGSLVTVLLGGRGEGKEHADPSWVVSDEVAGQGLALALAGAVGRGVPWIATLAAFLLFRALDVTKPGPVGAAERLPKGLGILADDLVAGAFAGSLVAGARAAGLLG